MFRAIYRKSLFGIIVITIVLLTACGGGDKKASDNKLILLSPHHGSNSSSTKKFLAKVQPRVCVISSGQGNYFGFPHEQTLERLQNIGCRVIRIDRSGAVQCAVGPNRFEISTFLETGSS